MSVISDFLIKQVKEKGWLSVGNIMFEDAVPCINPITNAGYVCLSPGSELIFSPSRMDTHNTYVIENGYLFTDFGKAGVQQTINVNPFDRLRQFDTLILSQIYWDSEDGESILVPKYPDIATVEGMIQDPETGLYPNTDIVEREVSGIKESTISPYPTLVNVQDYIGIRVKEYQTFLKNQKKFREFIQNLYGLSDCI